MLRSLISLVWGKGEDMVWSRIAGARPSVEGEEASEAPWHISVRREQQGGCL